MSQAINENANSLIPADHGQVCEIGANGQRFIVAQLFYQFINEEVLPNTTVKPERFWSGLAAILAAFAPRNRELLAARDSIQQKIDSWHRDNPFDAKAYHAFLAAIGYLQPQPERVSVETANVDEEIASVAGPQLVVPIKNARFAINAANARWGSLYDALYGTDVIAREGELKPGKKYNPARGKAVIAYARDFLDQSFPLEAGSHHDAQVYIVKSDMLVVELRSGETTSLQNGGQFIGYKGDKTSPEAILLRNHGLHIVLEIDRAGEIGTEDAAGIQDITVEAAISTIMDCEDSIAAVDAEDKVEVYRNWLGLTRGDLRASFSKGSSVVSRSLAEDKIFTCKRGGDYCLHGRSLMLIRNVGHLMNIDLLRDVSGNQVPEGIVDAVVTSLIASIDIQSPGQKRNSRSGSIYIVKPKMHGPEEVAYTNDLFAAVEDLLGLARNTLKLGIMDEERRTTVNLSACIKAARERVIFINTGFLDRTGDEIHTSMEAGPFLPKAEIRKQVWIDAYERWNVEVGLACGLKGTAQIGKGMWAMPDQMAQMMEQKRQHPESGATTAWVPSPTAAVLHALHYHQVDVASVQTGLAHRESAVLEDILTIPLMDDKNRPSINEVERELQNNIQGILGYVVRWIDQGVGCSKVPDINDIGLMEDRATLRISSQLPQTGYDTEFVLEAQVRDAMQRMAAVVDQQNAGDASYKNMSPNTDASLAFQAAADLIFKGVSQPNGYTEPLLHAYRRKAKALQRQQ